MSGDPFPIPPPRGLFTPTALVSITSSSLENQSRAKFSTSLDASCKGLLRAMLLDFVFYTEAYCQAYDAYTNVSSLSIISTGEKAVLSASEPPVDDLGWFDGVLDDSILREIIFQRKYRRCGVLQPLETRSHNGRHISWHHEQRHGLSNSCV